MYLAGELTVWSPIFAASEFYSRVMKFEEKKKKHGVHHCIFLFLFQSQLAWGAAAAAGAGQAINQY
jgi:hypothetical protein